jgi:hypothetical protein
LIWYGRRLRVGVEELELLRELVVVAELCARGAVGHHLHPHAGGVPLAHGQVERVVGRGLEPCSRAAHGAGHLARAHALADGLLQRAGLARLPERGLLEALGPVGRRCVVLAAAARQQGKPAYKCP